MEIFWRLVLGHLIGDFTLQTNHIAGWKRTSLTGMIVHCAIHPVIYSVLLWKYMGLTWLSIGRVAFTGWVCVFIIFAAHFVEDQWRVWSVLRRNAPDNTFFYVWDQVIHYAVLFAMAPAMEGASGKFGILKYPPIADVQDSAVIPVSSANWSFRGCLPSNDHVPEFGLSNPQSRLNSVVFPAPFGPMRAVMAWRGISR